MALNSNRRSGHSRRAQYSLFTGYALAALGIVIGAALLAISFFYPGSFSNLRTTAGDIAIPPGELTAETRQGAGNLFDEIEAYWQAGSQNAELRRELELARIRLHELAAVEQENMELKQLLKIEPIDGQASIAARMVGSTSTSGRRFAYLSAGRNAGIDVGMPVRSAYGIVGRVLEVGSNSARVLLLTDSQSILPVRLAGGDVVAFAEGRGDGLLRIRLINLGLNPLEPGDVFVTSGAGGYFRPGIAVAILEEVTADGGNARIIADPAAAHMVAVDPIWVPEAVEDALTPDGTRLDAQGGNDE